MNIRTPLELGAFLRDLRKKRGLDQGTLARQVGVSRQWILEMEKGKPRASLALVLRTLSALGASIEIQDAISPRARAGKTTGNTPDLVDQVLNRLKDKKS
jgi:HTH-type transcriptional regulator / antitoxin HipB